MKKTLSILTLMIVFSGTVIFAGTVPPDSTIYSGLTGKQLIDSLRARYRPSHTIAYAGTPDVRDTLFGVIDKTASDSVTCVYSTFTIYMQPGQDPDDWAYSHDFNTEHSWPQSYLNTSQTPDPTGDMNHLFPSDIEVNSSRGNYPFAEIPDAQTDVWYYNNTSSSSIPGSNIDLYGEYLSGVSFEPREQQKGNTARAMYYMLTMYQLPDTTLAWWTGQRDILYTWHCNDPANAAEIARTKLIAPYQSGKVNPFILDSTLIRRAYFPGLVTNTSVSFSPVSATKLESAGSCSLKVAISSPSGTTATSVQVVLTGGTGAATDVNNYSTQTLTFPAGSSTVQSTVLLITDDALEEGTETLVFTLRNVTGGTSAKAGADSVFTLTITDNDDATAPVITSGPSVTGIGSSSATVVWTTNEISNSWVYYGLTTSYSDTVKNESDVISHSVGLSGLTASTTYHYKVSSVDPLNNGPAYSGDNTFTTTAPAAGDTFLYEPFDYTAGTLLTANNWTAHSSAGTNAITVVTPGLTFSGYKSKAVTNACSLYSTGEDVHRMFAAQTTGPIYASFLVNVRSASTTGDYFFNFAPNPWTTTYYGRVYIKSDGGSNLAFGLTKASETPVTYTGTVYATNTTYLVVLKYSMVSGTLNDSVSLFVISTTIPPSEPGTPILGPLSAATIADPATIGAVALRQGSGGPVMKIDDIKIGSAWSSAPLAMELSGFTCGPSGNAVALRWRTESETGSYLWIISRAEDAGGPYQEICRLAAAGNSTTPADYAWTDAAVMAGRDYYYTLTSVDLTGEKMQYGPVTAVPGSAFSQPGFSPRNNPNPFSGSTEIQYQLHKASLVELAIYNAAGQLVRSFPGEYLPAGVYRQVWDGRNTRGQACPAGIYFYRLNIQDQGATGRMVLVR